MYKRYVDDILLFTDEDHFNSFYNLLNSIHPNISVSHEKERDNSLPFLDILMTRRGDGTLQRTIYRKSTWSGRYMQFSSFAPIAYKRGLVKTLFHRARCICTPDKLEEEEEFIKETLLLNGYPENFIEHHKKEKTKREPLQTVKKKQVLMFLPFKGDHLFNQVSRNLKSALKRTYMAAELRILQTTKGLSYHNRSKRPVDQNASHVIYQFTCSCGDTYIGRTDRCLAQRVAEHVPKWLLNSRSQCSQTTETKPKNPTSSIARHLMMTGHQVDLTQAFKVMLRNRNPKLLAFCEAVLIAKHRPPICAQKQLTHTVCLPWR